MANNAVFLRRFIGHAPDMRFVTILALHVHPEVKLMLSDLRNAGMAAQTVLVMGSYLARLMRLVARIAIELHRRICAKDDLLGLLDRYGIGRKEPNVHSVIFLEQLSDVRIVAVAEEALPATRSEILGPVGVAVNTSKTAHALAVHFLALMALCTEFFGGKKVMKTRLVFLHLSVALGAFDLLHVHVLGMEQRLVYPNRLALSMTLVAGLRAHNDLPFMTLRHRGWTLQNEADQQLVLLVR
jgi:hypothetical protein